ncbi:unnamed protein product [Soboliphyme baturini]|uniref:Guanylate cyclase domain-containing protein n=1 Tax=Soboliphyme baturini TaxID=241478 RepID=A0A183JB13_9BILA|nr:unnamed protein product [Soboliphyme baturini]
MESTSIADRIQASENTINLLKNYPQFVYEERGETEVKGKGRMKTYWILGVKEMQPDAKA